MIDWGDGTIEYINTGGEIFHTYTKGVFTITINGLVEMFGQFDADSVTEFTIDSSDLKNIEDGLSLQHLEKLYIHKNWQKELEPGVGVNLPNKSFSILPVNSNQSTWVIYDIYNFSSIYNNATGNVNIDNFIFADNNITNISGLFRGNSMSSLNHEFDKFQIPTNQITNVSHFCSSTNFAYYDYWSFPNANNYTSFLSYSNVSSVDTTIKGNNLIMDYAFYNTNNITNFNVNFANGYLHPDNIDSGFNTMFEGSTALANEDNFNNLLYYWGNTTKYNINFNAGLVDITDGDINLRNQLTQKGWTFITTNT